MQPQPAQQHLLWCHLCHFASVQRCMRAAWRLYWPGRTMSWPRLQRLETHSSSRTTARPAMSSGCVPERLVSVCSQGLLLQLCSCTDLELACHLQLPCAERNFLGVGRRRSSELLALAWKKAAAQVSVVRLGHDYVTCRRCRSQGATGAAATGAPLRWSFAVQLHKADNLMA